MGEHADCDFCGDRRPSTDLVPVQRRSKARACRDCAILMETRSETFVVEAKRPEVGAEAAIERWVGAPETARTPGETPDLP